MIVVLLLLAIAVLVGAVLWLLSLLQEVRAERDEANGRLQDAADGAEALREQLTEIEEQLRQQAEAARTADRAPVVVDDREFVITDMARERPLVPGLPNLPTVPVPFADTLLRESLIRTASLAAGLRHALSPEMRNRIRFEMKRDIKRSRKQRKADERQARREIAARRRAGMELSGR